MKNYLSEIFGYPITKFFPIPGGDISSAYEMHAGGNRFFVKMNAAPYAEDMFIKEKRALEAIARTNTIRTPEVVFTGKNQGTAVLVMEFIETKRADSGDFKLLGEQLAALHLVTADQFGLEYDNYIGSLSQSNKKYDDWADFYIKERLMPQFDLAVAKSLLSPEEVPEVEFMFAYYKSTLGDVRPSLLHGDLWSGNYLIAHDGKPYLIDPASYYGHREIDLAMSRLFGGFSPEFYQSYDMIIPVQHGVESRNDTYQLYYLLVHLNLFGRSYYSGVKRACAAFTLHRN